MLVGTQNKTSYSRRLLPAWKALIFVKGLTNLSLSILSLPLGSSVTFVIYIINIFLPSGLQPSTRRLCYVASLCFLLLTIQFSFLFPSSFSLPLSSYLYFYLLSLFLRLIFYSSFPSSVHTFCVVNFLRRKAGPPVFNSIKLRLMKKYK